MDLSSDAVQHAARTYFAPNLRFLEGRADLVPLPDSSVDLIVSFETIEHLDHHAEMLAEFKRVLRPDGMLLISSPNRDVYADEHENPFHLKELDQEEFQALLAGSFAHVSVIGQRSWLTSLAYPLDSSAALTDWRSAAAPQSVPTPEYSIALCCNSGEIPAAWTDPTFWLDFTDEAIVQCGEVALSPAPFRMLYSNQVTKTWKKSIETRSKLKKTVCWK